MGTSYVRYCLKEVGWVRLFTVEYFDSTKKPVKKLKRILSILLIAALIILVTAGVLFARGLPRMEKIIANSAKIKAGDEIDRVITSYMETNQVTYGQLVELHFDDSGAISSMTADTARIDTIIARMDEDIGAELEEKLMEASIPLNVLLGTDILAGAGPLIKVHFYPLNIVNINTRHEFISQGINQTLHTIYLDISVEIEVLLPLKNRIESVDSTILIGQTLIVGGVPHTYVER